MRLRSDSAHLAGWHRAINLGALVMIEDEDYTLTLAAPPAEDGDVWISYSNSRQSPIGYALTCPNHACKEGIHWWDHAWDCRSDARKCDGSGCWQWTGTPEGGDLTAMPSLHVLAERGGCGWHGWLRSGEMVSV